ncbi:hypothetical protein [Faecalibacterium wellingii]|uniref:Uncharacterized protein n=1 Tax=Faecalibacterium wellingii TaxID=2929491 RepID=A0ABU3TXE2_9FIRM|nr:MULTISPECIES: hypothetical protein [Faecalibacterium]MDU8687972.1 hypothetical protein [Faecalibacterium prausnitzii]UQK55918.1 hypothetical protein MTP37_09765 [Faecalibacterium sp. HTF-F]
MYSILTIVHICFNGLSSILIFLYLLQCHSSYVITDPKGSSQFERIPLSFERQERIIQEQIDETLAAINELKAHAGENFSIKQMEKTRKTLETKLEKLRSDERKDDVITFEQLGIHFRKRSATETLHPFQNTGRGIQ